MKKLILTALLVVTAVAAFGQAPTKATASQPFTLSLTVGSYVYIQNVANAAPSDYTRDALGNTNTVTTSPTFTILSNSANGYAVTSTTGPAAPANGSPIAIPCALATGSATGLTVTASAATSAYTGNVTASDPWTITFTDAATYAAPAASTSTWTATFTVTNNT